MFKNVLKTFLMFYDAIFGTLDLLYVFTFAGQLH